MNMNWSRARKSCFFDRQFEINHMILSFEFWELSSQSPLSRILEPAQQECPTKTEKSVVVIARSLVVSVLGMDNESSSRGCGGEDKDSEFVILDMSYFEVVICILMSSPTWEI